MNIKTSIYDFFAYMVPGALILLLGLHAFKIFGVVDYFPSIATLSFSALLLSALAAYLLGVVLDPVMGYAEKIIFKIDQQPYMIAFEHVAQRTTPANMQHVNPGEWAIWLASIRRESMDIAFEIDRFLAYSKMLRGVYFASLLAFLLLVSYVIMGKVPAIWLFSIPFLALFAASSRWQSQKFRRWFFVLIYETAISRNPPFTTKP